MKDSRTVANLFLSLAEKDKKVFTTMQLLKLTYHAHGWMPGLYQRPLIRDEVQAWTYGPVIPKLYEEIRQFKGNPVVGPIAAPPGEELTPEEKYIVEQTYQTYGHFTGLQLSQITHEKGTPWTQTYKGEFGAIILNDIIQVFYQKKAKEGKPY